VNEPTRECWNEAIYAYEPVQPRSYAGSIIGGVAGGLLGNQIGSGDGRTAATAAGAAVGALAGDRIDNTGTDRSYTGAILGSVAGGLLGSQIGAGTGRAAAAAAGAVAGGMIGDRLDNNQRSNRSAGVPRNEQRCRSFDNYRQVITGYTVLYRYNGREAEAVMPYKPGPTIKIGIAPVDAGKRAPNRPQ
jgi:uncharacterized protein YcfJ